MALDREDTLKKAEKLLRQGRLDAAIAEYRRVIEDQPKDWNTANTLGDLYVRAGQMQNATAQYSRIADHFMHDGFYPKAAALYKKILKISPDDETAQLQLAEISVRQGLLADAKSYLGAVAARRRARGDRRGADEIAIRLAEVDPSDFDARALAARSTAEAGDGAGAAARFRQIYADLLERGRAAEAMAALREAARLNPADREARAILARAAVGADDLEAARTYLDRETAGEDPDLLTALTNIELRAGQLDAAREILPRLLALDRRLRERVIDLAWALTASKPEAAFVCVEAIVDAAVASSDFADGAAVLQEYVARVPNQIPALLRLVEVCVDGGLEATMYDAQAQLTDAYLTAGQAAEARVIAEDLVAREPWEHTHIDRFRQALILLNVPQPDLVIAERLSGLTPFTATDPFAEPAADFGEALELAPLLREERPPAESAPTPVAEAAPPRFEPPGAEPPRVEPPRVEAPHVESPRVKSPRVEPPVAAPETAPPPAAASTEIDISSMLAELSTVEETSEPPAPAPAPPPELEDLFRDFRTEITRQSGVEDWAQHIGLAETYLEMGMVDDAIESLKRAARSPKHRFEVGARLAKLFRQRDDLPQAIEWMEHAVEAPAPSAEEGRALLYELGATLESAGETARALAVFLELQSEASAYRDIEQRIDRLSRVQTGG